MDQRDLIQLLREGGRGNGVTWADLGSGEGALALALADLLGPTGSILTVDRSSRALRVQLRVLRDAARRATGHRSGAQGRHPAHHCHELVDQGHRPRQRDPATRRRRPRGVELSDLVAAYEGSAGRSWVFSDPELQALLERVAERFGIAPEVHGDEFAGPAGDLPVLIEEAVARGVARGLREALGERQAGTGATAGDHTATVPRTWRPPPVGMARSTHGLNAADVATEPVADEPRGGWP